MTTTRWDRGSQDGWSWISAPPVPDPQDTAEVDMATKVTGQVGMDEAIIDDPDLEEALERRERIRGERAVIQADYSDAHDAVKALVASLDIPEDGAVRVGRFRITKSMTKGGHVEFDVEPKERVHIEAEG